MSVEIEFSQHSLDQLKIRTRITKEMVLEVLGQPDGTSGSFRGRELFQKHYDQEVLEVVAIREDNKLTVITEYFLEQ
jgi:hypothetical protein